MDSLAGETPGIEDDFWRGTHFIPKATIRSVSGKQSLTVTLPKTALMNISNCEGVQLLGLDMKKRKLIVSVHKIPLERPIHLGNPTYFSIDIDKGEVTKLAEINELKAHQHFRLLDNGWVAWGALDDSTVSKRIVWSLPSGREFYDLASPDLLGLVGANIWMAAVSPDGKWFAVSFEVRKGGRGTGRYEKTYVLRTKDKQIVFDRPVMTAVAFIGNEFFAYNEYDKQKRIHQVHVVKIPKD